jgi:hypothetical protein
VPFSCPNYNATMLAIMNEPHRPLPELVLGVDVQLSALVDKCLTKDRERRIATAAELGDRLERIAMRLAMRAGDARFTPKRRATDRVSRISLLPSEPPAVETAPESVPSVRGWQFVTRQRVPRSVIAASTALGGTAIGIAIGVAIASPMTADPDDRRHSSWLEPSASNGIQREVMASSPTAARPIERGAKAAREVATSDAVAVKPRASDLRSRP